MTTLVRHNRVFPSIFDNFFSNDWMNAKHYLSDNHTCTPAVNITDNEKEYRVELAVPGMKKEDFTIKIENTYLIVSSEKKEEKENQNNQYKRREFFYQSFERRFQLPENEIADSKIAANYKDGILSITLPKKEEKKGLLSRIIKIS